jgi:hypothetical protein
MVCVASLTFGELVLAAGLSNDWHWTMVPKEGALEQEAAAPDEVSLRLQGFMLTAEACHQA